MNENAKLRSKLNDLACEIVNEVDHGECFYDYEMLIEFFDKLDALKQSAIIYYESNREEE